MIIDEVIKDLQERGTKVGVTARDFYDKKYYDGPIIQGIHVDIADRGVSRRKKGIVNSKIRRKRGPDKKPRKRRFYKLVNDFEDHAEAFYKDMMIKKEMMKNKGL